MLDADPCAMPQVARVSEALHALQQGQAMVFCNTVKQAENMAEALQAAGHDGMPSDRAEAVGDVNLPSGLQWTTFTGGCRPCCGARN